MKFKDPDTYTVGEVILFAETIDARLDEIVSNIAKKYKNKHLLLVGLLTGAAWLTVDILEKLHLYGVTDAELTFMKVSSYQKGTTPTIEPRIEYDMVITPQGREILLIDDIVDTGRTLAAVTAQLLGKKTATISSLVLLDKPSRREVLYKPDYCGFEIPNIWVQGRGMDSDGYGRGDPNIRKGPYHY
jgi:hypoxanthine phosphoribosyltransferase